MRVSPAWPHCHLSPVPVAPFRKWPICFINTVRAFVNSPCVCVLFLKYVHRYRNCTRTGLNFRRSYTSGCSLGAWQPGEGHWGVLGLYLLGECVLKVTIATQGLTGAWTKLRVRSILGEDNEGENEWMSE